MILGILRDEKAERIAATLGREPSTVKSHIQSMRKHYNVGSRAGIVTLVLGTLIHEMQQDIDRLKAEVEALRGEGWREAAE